MTKRTIHFLELCEETQENIRQDIGSELMDEFHLEALAYQLKNNITGEWQRTFEQLYDLQSPEEVEEFLDVNINERIAEKFNCTAEY